MRQFVLAMMLAAFTACSGGVDSAMKCPDGDKQLTREEWKACYGEQEEDTN